MKINLYITKRSVSMKKDTENQKERENPMFEFDWIMRGVDALLEGANNESIQQRKNLEKQLIRLLVASPSKATSQTRKNLTRERKSQGATKLKNASDTYKNNVSAAAKGQWVDAALDNVQSVSDRLMRL
ncbi:TPA: hypothetical protein ACF3DK_002050 [Enterococcus faecium]